MPQTMLHVYADYGFTSETRLCTTDDLEKARQVFSSEDPEDFPVGIIEIARFAADGEYLIEERKCAEDYLDWA